MRQQRWVFTEAELANPDIVVDPDDEFIAYLSGVEDVGVVVKRDGVVLNRWSDGTAGVSEDQAELADAIESLNTKEGVLAENWRDVLVDDEGKFCNFAPPPAGYWAVALTNEGEEMHWGKDGDTFYPYITKAEAIDQCKYVAEVRTQVAREEDRLYVMTVFVNGQILWEEFDR